MFAADHRHVMFTRNRTDKTISYKLVTERTIIHMSY